MTFTYTDPTASSKDEVRFLIGDTNSAGHLIEDEEIGYLYAKWFSLYGTVEYVAAMAAESLAAKFARESNYSADGVSVSLANLAQQFRDLAASLRERSMDSLVGGTPDAGGISPYEGYDPEIVDKDFGTGMHDNPEAGRQNYGSRDFIYGFYNPYDQPGA